MHLSITNIKKTVLLSLLVFLIYCGLGVAVYLSVYDIIKLKNLQFLNEKIDMVKDVISIFNETSKKSSDKMAEVFTAMFKGRISFDDSITVRINELDTPVLKFNNRVLNLNNTFTDRFTEMTGGSVATIFVKKDQDFIRIATSLKKEDGSLAIGTTLGKAHPGYKNLIKGEVYTGKANLFGRDYMTKYVPIKTEKDGLVGIFFVGYDITDALKSLTNYILSIKVYGNGFFFIIDENDEKSHNTLLVRLSNTNHDSNNILKEILHTKEGIITLKTKNEFFNLKGNTMTIAYSYFRDWNWIVGIGIYNDVILKEVMIVRNILLVVGLLSILVIGAILFIAFHSKVDSS